MDRLLNYCFAMLLGAVPALVLFGCLLPFRKKRMAEKRLRSCAIREWCAALFWLFCGGMAVLTLLPRWVPASLRDVLHGYRWNAAGYPFFQMGTVNLRPFQTLYDMFIFWGNIAVFIPVGFFTALLWRGYTWRRSLVTGLCVTGFIECWQLFIGRAFDIDDLLLNTLGVLCGYWLWRLLRRLLPSFTRRFHCGTV